MSFEISHLTKRYSNLKALKSGLHAAHLSNFGLLYRLKHLNYLWEII